MTFLEIGCAPGGWMAYFNRRFGYSVAGIEYTIQGANLTSRNMEILEIDAQVIHADFLKHDWNGRQFDVVFSAGFIEHFRNPVDVIKTVSRLSRRYVVTLVPNVHGVNGLISKTIRPLVYAEHNPLRRRNLIEIHAPWFRSLFSDYIGGMRFIMPAAQREFFARHRVLATVLNVPFRSFNAVSSALTRWEYLTPRNQNVTDSILYIGARIQ
jgi:SAM-dependent methyltransferase